MPNREFKSLEDVRAYQLDEPILQRLLAEQYECTLTWTSRDGQSLGVTNSYVHRDGVFWMVSEAARARVRALRRDPRASIVISGVGTKLGRARTVTFKGIVEIIDGDRDLNLQVLREINERNFPGDPEAVTEHTAAADNPGRVVLKFHPTAMTNSFDGAKTIVTRE